MVPFGKIVREVRHEQGLSQSQVAKLAGMVHGHWSKIEHSSNPSLATIARVATTLDVSPVELVQRWADRNGY